MTKWHVSERGIATLGPYEVRVTKRLANSMPVRWTIFKDGAPVSAEYKSFTTAKRAAEQRLQPDST